MVSPQEQRHVHPTPLVLLLRLIQYVNVVSKLQGYVGAFFANVPVGINVELALEWV